MSLEERVALMRPTKHVPLGALMLVSLLALAAPALAATVPSNLRVLTASGKTLADHVQYTGPTKIQASKKADCFGSPSSNESYQLDDANALGLLTDAERLHNSLEPVLITDSFFADFGSFGVCGIGGEIAPFVPFDPDNPKPTPYWYLAHERVAASAGPNQLPLEQGDDVLYYLTEGTEPGPPLELGLEAPTALREPQVFRVKVYEYNPANGKRSPASGAEVAGRTTDKAGRAKFGPGDIPPSGRLVLQATRGQDVPSSRQVLCVGEDCEPKGELILGSPKRDQIGGTEDADRIKPGGGRDAVKAGAGNDRIVAKRGGRDTVDCGAGDEDSAKVDRKDKVRNCEQVKRA